MEEEGAEVEEEEEVEAITIGGSLSTKYISTRGCEMGKRARTAGRNSEIQAEHSGGEMGYQGANIWAIQANEG